MSKDKPPKSWVEKENQRKASKNKDDENLKARGRGMGNFIRPVSTMLKITEKSVVKAVTSQRASDKPKTHAERVHPEKAATDPRIQALRENKSTKIQKNRMVQHLEQIHQTQVKEQPEKKVEHQAPPQNRLIQKLKTIVKKVRKEATPKSTSLKKPPTKTK